jgi:putative membrane-bound dehydrogenase-like protein
MKSKFLSFGLLVLSGLSAFAADAPLRVFIRGGVKTHAPGAHEHAQFLKDWQPLLASRGLQVDGGMDLPSDDKLKQTDVLLMYAQDGGTVPPSRWAAFDEYLKRGGGLVVVHTAAVSREENHWKAVTGGCWRSKSTKWKEGPMDLYYVENQRLDGGHPITRNASNFHIDDEIYYDMDVSPDVRVLATAYTPNVRDGKNPAEGGKAHIYDIQPQMWTYERTMEGGTQPYRAFVSIPGHLYTTFQKPHYRAILLRGLAWAGKRNSVDEFCSPEELSSLTYPEGGPQKPEATLKNLEVHPDFDMTLVTAEPLITKPMNFDWDASGRLWVAETPEYPNGRRGMRPDYRGKEWKDHGGLEPQPGIQDRPGMDKISILTDTNADGVMDKKEVFHQGLDLVTGLVFYKDGVIVTQAPDILWLRDTDADGKADKVEKLYTNLGTGDTHAVINNPRMGWDGWIYATHGYSASADVTSGDGSQHFGNIGSGVVRFQPDGSKIEQYSSKGGNTWGLTITGDNRVMWTQPTSGTLLNQVVLPEYALARGKVGNTPSFNTIIGSQKSYSSIKYEDLAYVQIDRVGDFTAGAGAVIYDGGAWPAEYNGDYFTTEPTINLIHHQRLTPKTTSYEAHKLPGREETEFIRSTDKWWRPIEVRTGPDGAMYVGDFYNQAVIHNDTRGPDHNAVNAAVRPDRDHYFGRIWRIQHKQAKKLEVPNLTKADPAQLTAALAHPNRAIRLTASRLLIEKAAPAAPIANLLQNGNAEAKIAALWTLSGLKSVSPELLTAALADSDLTVRRNAAGVAEASIASVQSEKQTAGLIGDPDATVRVTALRALGSMEISDAAARQIIAAWPKLDDDFQRSAAVGAASRNPAGSIAAALDSAGAADLIPLVSQLVDTIARDNNTAGAAKLVTLIASKPESTDPLKRSILDTLGKFLKDAPAMTPELSAALGQLLASGVSGSVLPVAAKWDRDGSLKAEISKITTGIAATLTNVGAAEEARLSAARSLLGLRSANPESLAAVTKLLGTDAPAGLQRGIVSALGELNEPSLGAVMCTVYGKLPADVQNVTFETLLKRADWALALLDAITAKQVDPASFGPANAFRLRTYPDKVVAKRANDMLDQLNPMAKAKEEIIAKLAPLVEKPGDAVRGKLMFQATCATCHKFGDSGAEIGPGLTGMGSHGPAELLTAIVDPNREVEPSFLTWNIETKDGQFYAGIIVRENPSSITLKSLAGQQEVKVADIKSRVNTGRSLMPEGFDGLGEEVLRDILTYMVSVDGGKFRTLDLRKAYTANTAQGLYLSPENKEDSIILKKTGTVNVEGIPFNILAPEKSATGNVVVLKGGGGYARTMPQRVEVAVGGFKANRLHFLGGIAGWGAKDPGKGEPALKVTVNFADGQKEELLAYDGVEFADYIGRFEVPGSRYVPDLLKNGAQLRWYTKLLSHTGAIDSVVMESFANSVAPTTLAVTAELAEPGAPAPGVLTQPAAAPAPAPKTAAAEAPQAWGEGTRVLLAGGGSSHDFQKYFKEADTAILKGAGYAVQYTEDFQVAANKLAEADVLVFSTNQGTFGNIAFRAALEQFAAKEKGIVLLHAGLWYNFKDWPEFNKVYAGGGSRGHDNLSKPFEVKVTKPEHPIMRGVPASFTLTDELYYMIPDAAGSPIEVLGEAISAQTGKVFPNIFTVRHEKARIAGIALGHDARAHDLPAFQTLLKNAVAWAAGK